MNMRVGFRFMRHDQSLQVIGLQVSQSCISRSGHFLTREGMTFMFT